MSASATSVVGRQLRIEQRIFWRNRQGVFFTFVFPLMLVLFAGLTSGTVDGVDRRAFIVTGILALSIVSTTFQALAIAVSIHRDLGVLKRLLATPLRPLQLALAKIGSVVTVAALEVLVIVLVARFAYDIPWPVDAGVFLVSCAIGAAAFSALGLALAAAIRSGDVAPAVTNAVYLPMMIVSGVFYSTGDLPPWLAPIAEALPLFHLVEPLRAGYLGTEPQWGSAGLHLLVLALWGVAGLAYVVRYFRWEPHFES